MKKGVNNLFLQMCLNTFTEILDMQEHSGIVKLCQYGIGILHYKQRNKYNHMYFFIVISINNILHSMYFLKSVQ